MISLLFVCQGNICRSPCLQAVMSSVSHKHAFPMNIDSCGLSFHYLGCPIHSLMVQVLQERGIAPLEHKARLFNSEDWKLFDMIFAVDRQVLEHLQEIAPDSLNKRKLHLATEFSAEYSDQDIQDPYYGDREKFKKVCEMSLSVCEGIVSYLKKC